MIWCAKLACDWCHSEDKFARNAMETTQISKDFKDVLHTLLNFPLLISTENFN
jgi:hypothetical protein